MVKQGQKLPSLTRSSLNNFRILSLNCSSSKLYSVLCEPSKLNPRFGSELQICIPFAKFQLEWAERCD